MCAGTVVEPAGPTSAAMVSITSRSRSVALRPSFPLSERSSTLARIGIVLRRSTTRCTWPRDLRSAARSTVTFIARPRSVGGNAGAGGGEPRNRGGPVRETPAPGAENVALARLMQGRRAWAPGFPADSGKPSLLQQALEQLDLLGQDIVLADQALDLAHRVQHGGVVAPAETAAN